MPKQRVEDVLVLVEKDARTGAADRKSRLSYSPAGVRTSANPPPPMPELYAATVPTQRMVATTASAALPPSARICAPTLAAMGVSHATAPFDFAMLEGR